jgi:uncharacterized membrane protein
MTRSWLVRAFSLAALIAPAAPPAWSGGPNLVYDAEAKTPYVWKLHNWPAGEVPVYTDLGTLGRLSNTRADELVAIGVQQWVDVPTSSFKASVAGDFASLGLPDITCPSATNCNALSVMGTFNGGGVHVIYDHDGLVLRNVLGVFGALGVTGYDAVAEGDNELLESWVVLSGPSIPSVDPNGVRFQGVVTHELGHAWNLAHSQGNGAALLFADRIGATGCVAVGPSPTTADMETMYPSISMTAAGMGDAMGTVERLDDTAAISDLYPMAGWRASTGSIHGTVYAMHKAMLVNTGDEVELTGVNVVARNLADPLNDYVTQFTGVRSKGQAGYDGRFELNGLTPGADYVVYIDGHVSGAMSVPLPLNLPGPEEFYNGPNESGNGTTDARCEYHSIAPIAGQITDASIFLNRVAGAPELLPMPPNAVPSDITADGMKVVGRSGTSAFMFTPLGGAVSLGGYGSGGAVGISADGAVIAYSDRDANGKIQPAIWNGGTSWSLLGTFPGATGCGSDFGSTYDISGDGSTVVGLGWVSCAKARGFKWTAAEGMVELPKAEVGNTRSNRANTVNWDGSLIGGWDDSTVGLRRGVRWSDGVATLMSPDPANYFVGETLSMTQHSSMLVGYQAGPLTSGATRNGWRWTEDTGIQEFGNVPGQRSSSIGAVSEDGRVMGGWVDFPGNIRLAAIWADGLGWADFTAFLNAQGTFANNWELAVLSPIASDGRAAAGWAFTRNGQTGFWVRMRTTVICHAAPHDPTQTTTMVVDFPDNLPFHLGHGDTIGYCVDEE